MVIKYDRLFIFQILLLSLGMLIASIFKNNKYSYSLSNALILSMFGIYLIMVEIAQSFSKWSKKVMKKYKQLKGENNGKI